MTYENIKNDKKIIKILKDLDNQKNEIYHGFNHSLNIIDNIEKLCSLLKINDKDKNLLKIAAYLHDIGHIYGKENHHIKSYEFSKEYLKDKLNETDYIKVINAIKKHHEKENIDELSLFEHILLLADKMDFSYKRVNINNKEDSLEKDILEIDFDIKDNIFYINIKTNNLDLNKFKEWPYYNKITKRIEEFSKKINKDYKIKIF